MCAARSDIDVEDLARRMTLLEEQAFCEFAEIFGPRFRAFFIKRGLTRSDAEDVAVSCVTDIALKVERYRALPGGSFERWVFTFARNYLVDWWRNRHSYYSLYDDSQLSDSSWSDFRSDDGLEPDSDAVLAVRDAMVKLSETDRTLIRLRNLEGESTYTDVGRQLGISSGNARVRHFRALKRLKSLLEKDPRIKKFLSKAEAS